MTTLSAFLAFMLGAIVGSFLNVVIYRLPRGESLVRPRSRCPHCGTPISAWDNIPIASFLLLRGRCRVCRAPIAWRYPLVELTAGLLVVAAWLRDGSWVDVAGAIVLLLSLLAVFFIDLTHHIVPNVITYPGIAVGLLFAAAQGRFVEGVLAAVGAGLFFLLVAILSRGGMGGGDIKLAAMMGAFLGWPAIAVALLLAFTGGAAVGVLLIASGRRTRKDPIPFGPALAVGGMIALFFGASIVDWYVRW
jgi:leader peptidase (prepilin peptidase)/N-methyltransferase